jgi:O-antigen/teichoic acid export membrane protein
MPESTLKARSLTAFLWGSAGSALKLLIQIGAQIVLARLLGPEQYGLFAIGVIVISFSNFFADVGIAYGLIQRQNLTDAHIRFVFTWQLIVGVVVSLIVAGLSGPLAEFFREPRAESILLALAPICLVQAATAVSLNLLKRELNFKAMQIAQTTGYVLGYVAVGIPLALSGWQVWALVAAWSVQVTTTFLLFYWQTRHVIQPLLRHPDATDITGFGFKVLATNLINWMIGNIDRLVVARYMPSTAVGLYTTPYNLMFSPSTTLMGVVQSVMYSACARVQGEHERIGRAYLALVAAVTLGIMPVFFAISAVAETFVLALYGPSWAGAAQVLQPIALAMPLFLLWNITTPPLWTSGQPGLEMKMQLPMAILWLFASLMAVSHSLNAVAWTVLALYFVRAATFTIAVGKITRIDLRTFYHATRGGLLLSVMIALIAHALDQVARNLGVESAIARLLFIVTGCGLAWLLGIRSIPGLIHGELASMIREAVTRMPAGFARGAAWFFQGAYRK